MCLVVSFDEYRCLNEELFNFDDELNIMSDNFLDPCGSNPCEPHEMCINVSDFEYNCIGALYQSNNLFETDPYSQSNQINHQDVLVTTDTISQINRDHVFESIQNPITENSINPEETQNKIHSPLFDEFMSAINKIPTKEANSRFNSDDLSVQQIQVTKNSSLLGRLIERPTLDLDETLSEETMNTILDNNELSDACDPFPCREDEICVSLSDSEYECSLPNIEENEFELTDEMSFPLKAKINSALVINDPCSKQPCKLTEKCVSLNNVDFICVEPEIDTLSNPCLRNPCKNDEICIMLNEEQFECISQFQHEEENRFQNNSRITFEDKKAVIGNMLDELAIENECKTKKMEQIQHPFSAHHFILCKQDNSFSVMECPSTLVFNPYLNRCDYTSDMPPPACSSNPCKNNGKCLDLDNFQFKCMCESEFSGDFCERRNDPCFSNPCSFKGVCINLPIQSISYYCKCNFGKTYGLDCSRNAFINPCLTPRENEIEAYFSSPISDQLFIQCEREDMFVKFCADSLIWSQKEQACVPKKSSRFNIFS